MATFTSIAGPKNYTDVTAWRADMTAWAADTVTSVGAYVYAVGTPDYFVYECTARDGDFKTHATTEPNWASIAIGETIVDDMVTWTKRQGIPGNGDTVVLGATFVITANISRIPLTGSLAAISGNGQLVMGTGVADAHSLHVSGDITGGTVGTGGTISLSGINATSFEINAANIRGCASGGTNPYTITRVTNTSNLVITANILGGAASGSSTLINNALGSITVNGDVLAGSYSNAIINNTTATWTINPVTAISGIKGGTSTNSYGLLHQSGTLTLTVNGDTQGGTATGCKGIYVNNALATITINGAGRTLTGGTGTGAEAIYISKTGCTVNFPADLTMQWGSEAAPYSGPYPTWTPGATAKVYYAAAGTKQFAPVVSAADLKKDVLNGTITGSLVPGITVNGVECGVA
jgi:hypothetical protein